LDKIYKSIKIAKGELKSELVFKNANIINVFTNEIINSDVAVDEGKIIAIGKYDGKIEIDINGRYLLPGFIDAHVHIESSKVTPAQFARAVVPHGTTSVIADPHEIANVKGKEGIQYMIDSSSDLPLDVFIMLPSCVPATQFEDNGSVLNAKDLKEFINNRRVLGLGEMMDFIGVINGDKNIIEKIYMSEAEGKIVDGHGPMISGYDLNAYVAAGIKTEHECSTIEEMIERLRLGMYILIREGSAAKNLSDLIKAVNKDNLRRVMFCTDDRELGDLLTSGSIDNNIRLAIKNGIDPIDCIKMASLNPAEAYGLKGYGAIAPGYKADLVVVDNLKDFNIIQVYKEGKLVAENNKALFNIPAFYNDNMKKTVKINDIKKENLQIIIKGNHANVIKIIPKNLITEKVIRKVGDDIVIENGKFKKGKDILKIAVIERHKKTGKIGLGLIEGFGLKNGAIASTVAHDSHNLIVVGDNDEDIIKAINEIFKIGGGVVLVSKNTVIDSLPLEIGGLMTDADIDEVNNKLNQMHNEAHQILKIDEKIDPFMTLSFMALPVIPVLKITDRGLFDVERYSFIEISG